MNTHARVAAGIYGIGTDLVELDRLAAALARHGDRFAQRVLGVQEFDRYLYRTARVERRGLAFLGTRFAAKEAISKALGLGMRSPMSWRAVEILNDPSGKPVAQCHGALADFIDAEGLRLHVSVTDERTIASAFALAEYDPMRPAGSAQRATGRR